MIAFRGGLVDLAIQRRRIEGRNLHVAAVQGREAVLVVIAAALAAGAVGPQGLPAFHGDAAGRAGGIGEGVQHGAVDVGVGSAADLVLTVPGVAGVHHVGPVVEVQLGAVGAQFVVAVQHQHVLDDQTVGLAVILVFAHFFGPVGVPVHDGQVLVGAVDDLRPAGLVQAEQDVAVLVLIGSLDGGGVAGDDGVVVNADGEAGVLGLVDQPVGALGGVGVGVDADGIAGVVFRRSKAAQAQHHDQRQNDRQSLFHGMDVPPLFFQGTFSRFRMVSLLYHIVKSV